MYATAKPLKCVVVLNLIFSNLCKEGEIKYEEKFAIFALEVVYFWMAK